MAYKVIILYQLYMPSYFLGTFTEYPDLVYKSFELRSWRIGGFSVLTFNPEPGSANQQGTRRLTEG